MPLSQFALPLVATVLVTVLAAYVARRPSEAVGGAGRAVGAVVTAMVAGWLLAAPVLAATGGPLPVDGGASGYLVVLTVRAVSVVVLWAVFWRLRTERALLVALLVTLVMALPELGWALGR